MTRPMHMTTICLLVALCLLATPVLAGDGTTFGDGITGEETTLISELLAQPEEFEGETVRVKGRVTNVCKKRGCWMSFASDEEFQELRIKAEDGVIVFPMEAKGKEGIAEGTFRTYELTMEQTVARRQHQAEEHGEEFDPASITEPETFHQIEVTGAVVYGL